MMAHVLSAVREPCLGLIDRVMADSFISETTPDDSNVVKQYTPDTGLSYKRAHHPSILMT